MLAETVKDSQLHTFTILALATASRAGELWRLNWADVDLKEGRLLLRQTKNAEPRSAWVRGEALRLLEGAVASVTGAKWLIRVLPLYKGSNKRRLFRCRARPRAPTETAKPVTHEYELAHQISPGVPADH